MTTIYRIGVDVGQWSVGASAVEYDAAGNPVRLLAAVSHIHDAGLDPATGKSPQSRKATAGVARRTRRLYRNRARRLAELDAYLAEHGYPVEVARGAQTYEPWLARACLVDGLVDNVSERRRLLAIAIRHIARHRGWRSPWWSYATLASRTSPTGNLKAMLRDARLRFGATADDTHTIGQLGALSANRAIGLRRRTRRRGHPLAALPPGPVLGERVFQEDTLAELREILQEQTVPKLEAERICELVFHQTKASVPVERIGLDPLSQEPRASRATLEFQEFRIRTMVANLRIKSAPRGAESIPLTQEQYDRVVQELLTWRNGRPRWIDVAGWLGVQVTRLVHPSSEDEGLANPPTDVTSTRIEEKFAARSQIGRWWREVSLAQRADFVAHLVGPEDGELEDAVIDLDDISQQHLETLQLVSGRAPYSRHSLARMVAVMREQRCDLHRARKAVFGVPDDWRPEPPTLDCPVDHPAVANVNTIVRRFLYAAVARWGVPERVVVEHVRSAFLGHAAIKEYNRELERRRQQREAQRTALETQGIQRASDRDLLRHECLQRQGCTCLYCGAEIEWSSSELDHIVAASTGGSNRRENLVAVCRTCNAEKGKRPFAVFAATTSRPGITIADAKERMKLWNRPSGLTQRQFRIFISRVTQRLAQTEDDTQIDERTLASTAYAAREIRARVQAYLHTQASKQQRSAPDVWVFRGEITSDARKAGGFDDIVRLRGKDTKDRLDRRHHAVDAAVLTTLSPGIAVTLAQRSTQRRSQRLTGEFESWKEFTGDTPAARQHFDQWQVQARLLAQMLHAAIGDDRIPVCRPLRLRPSVGALHSDTVEKLRHKLASEAWTTEEINRVVDPQAYQWLTKLAGQAAALPADLTRRRPDGEAAIALFRSNAACIPVRGGAAGIGTTTRAARVLAWRSPRGIRYGMVRLYVGEFGRIGFDKPGIDVLTAPIPPWSEAMRTLSTETRKHIDDGSATQIGWLAINDELEFDPLSATHITPKLRKFLAEAPERRWLVTGFVDESRISIAPALMAEEGIDERTPELVADVLQENRVKTSFSELLSTPDFAVIRRTALGFPRWDGSRLPASWRPAERARAALRI